MIFIWAALHAPKPQYTMFYGRSQKVFPHSACGEIRSDEIKERIELTSVSKTADKPEKLCGQTKNGQLVAETLKLSSASKPNKLPTLIAVNSLLKIDFDDLVHKSLGNAKSTPSVLTKKRKTIE